MSDSSSVDNCFVTRNHLNIAAGVNFINVVMRSFYTRISHRRKKLRDWTVFFLLLGSLRVKAAHKMLVNLTPGAVTSSGICWRKKHVLTMEASLGRPHSSQKCPFMDWKIELRSVWKERRGASGLRPQTSSLWPVEPSKYDQPYVT